MQQPIDTNDPQVFATVKENQYFDRKSARKDADEIAKHIIAVANFAGGKLVIGIEDDGEITGFNATRRTTSRISNKRPSRAAIPFPRWKRPKFP